MKSEWRYTEDLIEEFKLKYKDRIVETDLEEKVIEINPQRIVSINKNYSYPEILSDYKMEKLKASYKKHKWLNDSKAILGFCLLKLPNGDLLVNGGGNHRAVLAKEEGLTSVKAWVAEVRFKG